MEDDERRERRVDLVELKTDMKYLIKQVAEIKLDLEKNYVTASDLTVTNTRLHVVEVIAYGLVALLCVGVIGAVLKAVFK